MSSIASAIIAGLACTVIALALVVLHHERALRAMNRLVMCIKTQAEAVATLGAQCHVEACARLDDIERRLPSTGGVKSEPTSQSRVQ